MPLSGAAVEELKAIHKAESGEDLTDDEAWEMGNRLLRVFDWLTRSQSARRDPLRSSNPVRFDDPPG